jgi:tetratricopeptide (TPR) repeat protein
MSAARYICLVVSSLVAFAPGCQLHQPSQTTDNLNGLGPVHHVISTSDPAAQRAFDEGLAYHYAFNDEAATDAFLRCAKLDPNCAMALWGQALGPGMVFPDDDRTMDTGAHAMLRKAVSLSRGASPRDRDYIAALMARYSDDPKADVRKHLQAYADAMRELSKRYPDDLDASALYAKSLMDVRSHWDYYDKDGKPYESTAEMVAVLEDVLRRNPNHVGANHYYIHATEASTTPGRALQCAKRLPTLAPRQAHLVHMPAHVYMRLGDYAAAIDANRAAMAVEDDARCTCRSFQNKHFIEFLAVAACYGDREADATDSFPRLLAERKVDGRTSVDMMRVRFGRWDEILREPPPDVISPTNATTRPNPASAAHFVRAMAHAGKGNVVEARRGQEQFESLRAKLLKLGKDDPWWIEPDTAHLLAMSSHLLASKLDPSTAVAELREAVAEQDKLDYSEPPLWPWSLREDLGAALIAQGRWREAREVFREDLRRFPNGPRSARGLAECEAALASSARSRDDE